MDFKDKVALITGAGKGIGKEIAAQLLAQGAKVVLNDMDQKLAQETAQELHPEHCEAVAGDCSQLQLIAQLVETAVARFGRVDLVVANAGITLFGDFFNYSEAAFSQVMAVNLKGSFFLAQATANQMRKQASGGAILLMSSVTGHQAHKDLAAYGMSKAALEMLAKNLVVELSPHRIRINALAPGATLTERTLEDPEYAQKWNRTVPLGRAGHVVDMAAAALFLLSDRASHITGQTLIVDGGWTSISPSPDA